MHVEAHLLQDDGHVPNHPAFPLLVYHGAFAPDDEPDDAIARFRANGWRGAWINGIFDFHHYHARSHEVLANLGRPVTVQFGGAAGPIIEFPSQAAVIIPAGGGHCRLSSGVGLVIVGAYPAGQEDWDLKRADNEADYISAKNEIARVPLPTNDPVMGHAGPLLDHWKA
jgi:uncharacterized protein YjlB